MLLKPRGQYAAANLITSWLSSSCHVVLRKHHLARVPGQCQREIAFGRPLGPLAAGAVQRMRNHKANRAAGYAPSRRLPCLCTTPAVLQRRTMPYRKRGLILLRRRHEVLLDLAQHLLLVQPRGLQRRLQLPHLLRTCPLGRVELTRQLRNPGVEQLQSQWKGHTRFAQGFHKAMHVWERTRGQCAPSCRISSKTSRTV